MIAIISVKGYKVIIVMPNDQSQEKVNFLKTTAQKWLNEDFQTKVYSIIKRIAEEKNANWSNQFDNLENRKAHIETTSKEIWKLKVGLLVYLCYRNGGNRNFSAKKKNKNIKIFWLAIQLRVYI